MDKRTKNGQTNRQNYTNFDSNLAMMVMYLSVKFEFDWTKHFRLKSPETEMLNDRQTDNGQTNRQNNTNFESNVAMMMLYLPVKIEFHLTKRFRVRVRKQKC